MPLTFSERPTTLTAELLDDLPPNHPDAISSRRDLRLFNAALGNWRWMQARVPALARPGERVLEIGAGTGELGIAMAQRGLAWDGLDRAPRPAAWPASAHWHQTDLFQFDNWADYGVVAGSLVFHHFDADQLAQLGRAFTRHARVVVGGDLRRGWLQRWLFSGYARAIGANRVSRHDGVLSIRAGFRGAELAQLLQLDPRLWTWRTERGQIFAYRWIAERRT